MSDIDGVALGPAGTSTQPVPSVPSTYVRVRNGRAEIVRRASNHGQHLEDRDRHCDVCLITGRSKPVLRFNLTRDTGRGTTRGAGSIYMCETCWTKTGKPRMRVAKRLKARQAEAASRRRLRSVGAVAA